MSIVDVAEILRPTRAHPRYGTVLLPVECTRAADRLIEAAVGFANEGGSRLLGLACAPGDRLPFQTSAEQDAVQRLMEASGERFETLTQGLRAGGRWRRCDGSLFNILRAHAWAADLILLSDVSLRGLSGDGGLRRLMRFTACPVLIWPQAAAPRTLSRAAVLCAGSPASARAIRSAAPILSRCSTITLVGADAQAATLKRGLEARGVADVRVVGLEPPSSHLAAQRLLETTADVVVAGGWPEPLGGWPRRSVSDRLLADCSTPLLMAS